MKLILIVGAILLVAPPAFAQADPSPSPTLNAERRSEQALPRGVVPFDPAHSTNMSAITNWDRP
jgi:hypothetical protein